MSNPVFWEKKKKKKKEKSHQSVVSWTSSDSSKGNFFYYTYTPGIRSMSKGEIVFVGFVRLFVRPSFRPSVLPSARPWFRPLTYITKFYFEVYLITYNSAATDQKLFIFGMGVLGGFSFFSASTNPWVTPWGRAKGQNLGHPNKVVYCSLFIQTTF